MREVSNKIHYLSNVERGIAMLNEMAEAHEIKQLLVLAVFQNGEFGVLLTADGDVDYIRRLGMLEAVKAEVIQAAWEAKE